jgi:hypothetical protein
VRAHAGHCKVFSVGFYLWDALVAWLKFKGGHALLFPSPCEERQINTDFVKLPNKGKLRISCNYMAPEGSSN